MALGLGACLDDGGIELDLQLPATGLAPNTEQIAEVSLLYWEPGEPTSRITRPVKAGSADLFLDDYFEPGQTLRLAVELRTATQRVIGFGRTRNPVELRAGTAVSIPIEIRRPFVYMGGDTGIEAMDATQDAAADAAAYLSTIDLASPAQVAVPTYDGQTLLAVVERPDPAGTVYELHILDTEDHAPVSVAPVPLSAPASDVAISAEGRYAIVAHEGANGGLSIVDLNAARGGQAVVWPVSLGSVGRVSVGVEDPGRVYALANRLEGLDCAGKPESAIYEVSLSNGGRVERMIPLGTPAQDLAAADKGDFLVVADSCNSTLWRVPTAGGEQVTEFEPDREFPNVSAVALWNNNIWAVTSQVAPADRAAEGNASITVVSLDLLGNTETTIDLPPMRVDVETPVFSGEGQIAALQVDADGIYAFDLAVAPGANSIAILVEGTYFSQSQVDSTGRVFIPAMNIRTIEYLLVDVPTTSAVQHVLSRCEIEQIQTNAVINDWQCAQALDQGSTPGVGHEPRGISVLYGSR